MKPCGPTTRPAATAPPVTGSDQRGSGQHADTSEVPAWATAGCGLGSVAMWAFHGALDDVVGPEGSIYPMTQLAGSAGVPVDRAQLTVYPDLMHDGWDQACGGSLGDDIYSWMLGFSKP